MRITTFRSWVSAAVQSGVGAARRAGVAISRRIRDATGRIDAGTGVGDDESSFGGGRGNRAWIELVEEAIRRFKALFERSVFERRFPRFDAWVRKFLGLPARRAPELPKPKPKPRAPVRPAAPIDPAEAARLKAQLQLGRIQAHTSERFDLRQVNEDRARRRRARSEAAAEPPDDETPQT